MTRPRPARQFRLLFEEGRDRPWLIQYCKTWPNTWVDIVRFRQYGEAHRYVADARDRDKLLLEADR